MKSIATILCFWVLVLPMSTAGTELAIDLLEHSARVKELAKALCQNEYSPKRGITRGDGFIKVNGIEAPELVAIEDVMPHFISYYRSRGTAVIDALRDRGMKDRDRETLTKWLSSSPEKAIGEEMAQEVRAYKRALAKRKQPEITKAQAESFGFFQKQRYSEIVLRTTVELFEQLSASGQRVLHSYLFEQFATLTRVYWIRLPDNEIAMYQKFLSHRTSQ